MGAHSPREMGGLHGHGMTCSPASQETLKGDLGDASLHCFFGTNSGLYSQTW